MNKKHVVPATSEDAIMIHCVSRTSILVHILNTFLTWILHRSKIEEKHSLNFDLFQCCQSSYLHYLIGDIYW